MCVMQSTGDNASEILLHVPTADHRYPEGNAGTDRVQWTEDGEKLRANGSQRTQQRIGLHLDPHS